MCEKERRRQRQREKEAGREREETEIHSTDSLGVGSVKLTFLSHSPCGNKVTRHMPVEECTDVAFTHKMHIY